MFTLRHKLPSAPTDKFEQMQSLPTDFTFICKDGRVRAHRLILSAASSFLMYNILQSSGGQIFLPQHDARDIQLIVNFIYGQAVTVEYDRMAKLVVIAGELGLDAFAGSGDFRL